MNGRKRVPFAVQVGPLDEDKPSKQGRNGESYKSKHGDASSQRSSSIEDPSRPIIEITVDNREKSSLGAAVVVRNGEKSYKSGQPVISGLNMTVPCGSIYGLLGSSGCGKTTVLSCIVGTRKLDNGDVWLFGKKPGEKSIGVPGKNIGYMPQDISLYMEFSIGEILVYFGTLCGMSKEVIKDSKKFLTALLDLPNISRRIGTLSGGQQRRVSFATALIHEPELLILDEPTAGVDPVLRQNIWMHLEKLVSSRRTTVIITTHYIEEANKANNIGIMRNGRLLAESPPEKLISEYGTTSLEEIVLSLFKKDTSLNASPQEIVPSRKASKEEIKNQDDVPPMATVLKESQFDLADTANRIRALVGKNFTVIFRNPILLFFVICISSMELIIMCLSMVCPNITQAKGECTVDSLSCHYLRHIKKETIDLRIFQTESEALKATQNGNVWGYILFPRNFSTFFYERTTSGAQVDNFTLDSSSIYVRLDSTNKQVALPMTKALYDAFQDFMASYLSNCGFDPRQGESMLKYKTPIFGRDDTDFREYLAPSSGPALVFFFAIITSSIRYIKEKKCGMLERCLVLGVHTWEILLAYSISEFCVLLVQAILMYGVLTVLFSIKILGWDGFVVLQFLLSGYGGVSMGFMLGTVCTEEIQAAILAMAAFFPNFLLSGLVWPIEGMPVAMQHFAKILPCTLASQSIRSVTSRGWGLTHPEVWPGFAVLVGYILGYFVLTVLFHMFIRR